MRTAILRLVCDECGFIAQFETVNHEPLIATTDVPGVIHRAGWESVRKIGSSFSTHDTCPTCSAGADLRDKLEHVTESLRIERAAHVAVLRELNELRAAQPHTGK